MKKNLALLLALLIAVSLLGCTGAPAAQTSEPTETTEVTETTESTVALVDTEEKLRNALETSPDVKLDASLTLQKTAVMHAGEFDGQGNTLTGPVYVEDSVDTENGIAMQSGKLKNITIKDAYRCLGDTKAAPQMGNIELENVTVDGSTYALNFGQGSFSHKLNAEECKFYGWSSYTGFSNATFTDCTFGWDSTGSNGNLRPYIDTVLTGCKFEGKVEADGSVTPFGIKLRDNISGISITLENCYVGDTLITEENAEELLDIAMFNNNLYVLNYEE